MFVKRAECPVCNAKQVAVCGPPLFPKDFMPLWGEYDEVKLEEHIPILDNIFPNGCRLLFCQMCTATFSENTPSKTYITTIYDALLNVDKSRKKIESPEKQFLVLKIIQTLLFLAKVVQKKEKDVTLLDFGCGWGDFMTAASQCGILPYGVELSERKRQFMAGKGLFVHPTLKEFQGNFHFDLILSWQCLEHLPEPLNELKLLRTVSHNKTILLIGVPNLRRKILNQEIAKPSSQRTKNLNPIEHLTYFSGHTLTLLANRAGWKRLHTVDPLLSDLKCTVNSTTCLYLSSLYTLVRRFVLANIHKRLFHEELGTYMAFIPDQSKI